LVQAIIFANSKPNVEVQSMSECQKQS